METQSENRKITNEAIDAVRDNNAVFYIEALEYSIHWVNSKFKPFTSEEIRSDFELKFNKVADIPSVWGAVVRELKKRNLIIEHGFSLAKNKQAHCRPVRIWISKAYSDKQAQNRRIIDNQQLNFLNQ